MLWHPFLCTQILASGHLSVSSGHFIKKYKILVQMLYVQAPFWVYTDFGQWSPIGQ